MTTNEAAARVLQDAMIKFMRAYPTAKPAAKGRISFSVNRLKKEYDDVLGRQGSANYSDVTRGISDATGRLKSIADERDELANSMITAASILDVVTKVLGLIGSRPN
jgi:hypothetical protein